MTVLKGAKPRLLHCFGSASGSSVRRAASLIAAFGDSLDHSIVLATAGGPDAAGVIPAGHNIHFMASFPVFSGKPTPRKLANLAQAMADFDLVLTYDWHALNVAMAHTAFAQNFNLPPLIHHEIGFGENGARELGLMRDWYRRITLGRAFGLVVETEQLEGIALTDWQQPIGRVRRIAAGVKTADFDSCPAGDALRGIIKRDGEYWLGALSDLAADCGLIDLLASFALLPMQWQLVIWGDGPAKEAIRAEATRLEISHRVHLPGNVQDMATALGLLDIFVQPPGGSVPSANLVQAMAAGLPVLATKGSYAEEILSPENLPLLHAEGDAEGVADTLDVLADDAQLRADIGMANRERARTRFDSSMMVDAYRRLYASALQSEIV